MQIQQLTLNHAFGSGVQFRVRNNSMWHHIWHRCDCGNINANITHTNTYIYIYYTDLSFMIKSTIQCLQQKEIWNHTWHRCDCDTKTCITLKLKSLNVALIAFFASLWQKEIKHSEKMNIYIYIYIYIERERAITHTHTHIYIYIYIYIYRYISIHVYTHTYIPCNWFIVVNNISLSLYLWV